MTDAELAEAFQLIRQHSTPIVHPLVDSLERLYNLDRSMLAAQKLRADMTESLYGHRVYADNDQHSRRATDLRAVQ